MGESKLFIHSLQAEAKSSRDDVPSKGGYDDAEDVDLKHSGEVDVDAGAKDAK